MVGRSKLARVVGGVVSPTWVPVLQSRRVMVAVCAGQQQDVNTLFADLPILAVHVRLQDPTGENVVSIPGFPATRHSLELLGPSVSRDSQHRIPTPGLTSTAACYVGRLRFGLPALEPAGFCGSSNPPFQPVYRPEPPNILAGSFSYKCS